MSSSSFHIGPVPPAKGSELLCDKRSLSPVKEEEAKVDEAGRGVIERPINLPKAERPPWPKKNITFLNKPNSLGIVPYTGYAFKRNSPILKIAGFESLFLSFKDSYFQDFIDSCPPEIYTNDRFHTIYNLQACKPQFEKYIASLRLQPTAIQFLCFFKKELLENGLDTSEEGVGSIFRIFAYICMLGKVSHDRFYSLLDKFFELNAEVLTKDRGERTVSEYLDDCILDGEVIFINWANTRGIKHT